MDIPDSNVDMTQTATSSAPAPAEKVPSQAPVSAERRVTFDPDILISRGIDPKLAAMFNEKSLFLPGTRKVTLFVNGENLGSTAVRFDAQGHLCFDNQLLNKAGLSIPKPAEETTTRSSGELREHSVAALFEGKGEGVGRLLDAVVKATAGPFSTWANTSSDRYINSDDLQNSSACSSFMAAYPQTDVELRPSKEEVRLAVPSNAFKPVEPDLSDYSSGGAAAILNYEVLKTESQFSGGKSGFTSINTEAGLNLGDWSVRSRHILAEQNGVRNTEQLYTYAEHSVVPFKSILQVGQINLVNPVLPGASITGVQVVPDGALRDQVASGATIDGIATTPQARVEVKQEGILIYSTVVPAGPFHLNNVPLLRGNSNVDVTVFESDNSQRSFTLPAASLRQVGLTTNGLSMAAGKVRNIGSALRLDEPMVVTVGDDWLVSPSAKFSGGVMLAQDYTSGGAIVDQVLTQDTRWSVGSNLSQANVLREYGFESSVALSSRLTENLSTNGSLTRRSAGYRTLMDTLQTFDQTDFTGSERTQLNVGANWSSPAYGSFGASYMQSRNTSNEWGHIVSFSWGKSLAGLSMSANLQHDLTGEIPNSAYLSVSIPLGPTRSLRTFASRSSRTQQQVGTTYSEAVSDRLNYNLSASQQLGADADEAVTLGGNVAVLPRYAQLYGGYTDNGPNSSNYNLGAIGGLVLHANGLTASPYPIQDTFGIISAGEDPGVKLITSSGPVWTDGAGEAVAARLPAFHNSQVEVMSYTLPRNASIDNGYKSIGAGRGSVNYLKFNVSKVRRVLLSATDDKGAALPKGAVVFDRAENFVTVVLDNGKIFLEDVSQSDLTVSLKEGGTCQLTFSLDKLGHSDSPFEQAPALCTSVGIAPLPRARVPLEQDTRTPTKSPQGV
jgi:outer membrane usher protein FimD/PapC